MIWRYARYAFAPLLWAPTVDGSTPVKKAKLKAGGSSHSATNPFKTLLSTLRFMPRSRVPKIYGRSWQNHEMGKLEPSFPANYTKDRNWKAGHNFPARLLFKIVLLTTQGVPWPPQVHAASELHRSSRKSFQVISDDVQVLWNDTSSDTTSFFQVILSGFQHVSTISCFALSKTSSISSPCSKKPVPWSANFTDLSWSQMPCSWCFYPPKRHQDSLRSIAFPHIPMKWLNISPEIHRNSSHLRYYMSSVVFQWIWRLPPVSILGAAVLWHGHPNGWYFSFVTWVRITPKNCNVNSDMG